MDDDKHRKLQGEGWMAGSVSDFLALSREEQKRLENLRMALIEGEQSGFVEYDHDSLMDTLDQIRDK